MTFLAGKREKRGEKFEAQEERETKFFDTFVVINYCIISFSFLKEKKNLLYPYLVFLFLCVFLTFKVTYLLKIPFLYTAKKKKKVDFANQNKFHNFFWKSDTSKREKAKILTKKLLSLLGLHFTILCKDIHNSEWIPFYVFELLFFVFSASFSTWILAFLASGGSSGSVFFSVAAFSASTSSFSLIVA